MGRINKYSNGDRVNQHRKSQGKFLEKQDIESYLLSNKLNNGNNIQGKNTPNIDDLPNIPAMLDYAPSQDSIEPIDGGTAHNLTAQAFLTFASLFSMTHPKTTVPPREAILTDNPNSLLGRATSATEVSKPPVLFGTTPSTSQNHAPSKKLTKDPSLIRKKDGLIRHDADGNIILGGDGKELTFIHNLDIKILKKQLTNNINITKLCLWALKIDPQEVQDIGEILKDSNVEELSIIHSGIKGIDFGILKYTRVTKLNLPYNGIVNKSARDLIKSLEGTNVEELNLSNNRIGNTGKGAKGLLTLLKKTKVKVLDLSDNNMSDNKVNDIIPELENTKIVALGLKDKGIERNTLKEVSKVLKQNRHVNKKSYIKSSPTEEESTESSATKEKSPNTSNKREKRDVHTTDETSQQETTVLTTDVSSTTATESTTGKTTVPTTKKSSTTTMKVTTSSPIEDSTTTEQETTPLITEEFSTTTMKVTTSSTEGSTTTEQETILPITEEFSTTTKRVTTSATEGLTTTEQETTVPTTLKSSTTTTKSTASSAGNPTTLKEELTTPKKNLTEKSEPIAADVVVDSITEKHTPEELNPNNPASSTMSTKEILALISFVLTAVSIGGGVAICVVKKFWGGVSHLGHEALALADSALVELDNCLDNNHEETPLAGVTVVTVDDNANI